MKYITPILTAILTISTLSLHQKFENATVKPKEVRNVFELSGKILDENNRLKFTNVYLKNESHQLRIEKQKLAKENKKLKDSLSGVALRDPLYALEVGK